MKMEMYVAPELEVLEVLVEQGFAGSGEGEGKKSVSFRVTLRAADRTLTVEEADKVSGKYKQDARLSCRS